MNKSEQREVTKLLSVANMGAHDECFVGYAARGLSALARCSNLKTRNEILALAMGVPEVIQHPDFII